MAEIVDNRLEDHVAVVEQPLCTLRIPRILKSVRGPNITRPTGDAPPQIPQNEAGYRTPGVPTTPIELSPRIFLLYAGSPAAMGSGGLR